MLLLVSFKDLFVYLTTTSCAEIVRTQATWQIWPSCGEERRRALPEYLAKEKLSFASVRADTPVANVTKPINLQDQRQRSPAIQ